MARSRTAQASSAERFASTCARLVAARAPGLRGFGDLPAALLAAGIRLLVERARVADLCDRDAAYRRKGPV
jgi:hypothetical protein